MRVSNIQVVEGADHCELRADVSFQTHWVWGDSAFPLWYRFPTEYAPCLSAENGDPFVAALLPPAMFLNETLSIEAPVSRKLWEAIPQIQSIYRSWYKSYAETIVEAPVRQTAAPRPASYVGLFFSMGVDSSYTLCKNLQDRREGTEPITHLILINGFDVYLWEETRFPPLLNAVNHVAAALNKAVLPVTTNLREFSDRVVDWVRAYHGPALASVVLALGGAIRKAHISASSTYANLAPHGTHPLVDPLWGTEGTSLVHDGLEATRLEKIRFLASSPVLLANLRVCATGEITDVYNCGRCEKCLRTMIGLQVAGLLEQCRTLPHKIDVDLVRSMKSDNIFSRAALEELQRALGDSPQNRALRAALDECLNRASQSKNEHA